MAEATQTMEILFSLDAAIFSAISELRKNKKRSDCKSICTHILKKGLELELNVEMVENRITSLLKDETTRLCRTSSERVKNHLFSLRMSRNKTPRLK